MEFEYDSWKICASRMKRKLVFFSEAQPYLREANRLQGVVDDTHQSYYQYDANGERTYKLTTSERAQLINGHWNYYTVMDNATLYASPYLVATVKGYTKHYYAESERIASRIGRGGLASIDTPIVDLATYTSKISANSAYFDTVAQNRLNTPIYTTTHLLDTLYYWKTTTNGNTEPDCYWYHPDHLGSASWVTSSNGDVVQYLYYLPWGEDYLNQRRNGYAGARYTFSAKERDTETGYSYFGSRYYSSELSIWLSVDPMSDKYPSLSPYTYCANNPVKLVDPNGEEWEVNESGYVRQVGDKDNHTLYAVKGTLEFSFGERKTKEDGTFISMTADEQIMNTMTCDGNNFTGFIATDNRDKMIETFNFMADNTNVEWAMIGENIEVGSNTIQKDFLYTNHDNIRCDARFNQVVTSSKKNSLDYHRHSHPNRYTGNNPFYAIIYPITSHCTSSKDRNLRDAASPSNYVSVRPDFILRNNGYDIHY